MLSRSLALAAATVTLALGTSAQATAVTTYQLLLQSREDASAPNEVFVASLATLDDLFNANTASPTGFTQLGISPGFQVSGLTWDGIAYRMLLGSRADASAPNEVFMASFATRDDLFNANTASPTGFTQLGISAGFQVSGLTWDGIAYRMLLESRADASAPNEVFMASFATLDDLFNANTAAPTGFTQLGISPGFQVSGLTWDGIAYRMLLESRADASAPNEVFMASFATLDDLFNANTASPTGFTQLGISPGFRIAGFSSVTTAPPPPTAVPEPGTLALLGLGLAGLGLSQRRRAT